MPKTVLDVIIADTAMLISYNVNRKITVIELKANKAISQYLIAFAATILN